MVSPSPSFRLVFNEFTWWRKVRKRFRDCSFKSYRKDNEANWQKIGFVTSWYNSSTSNGTRFKVLEAKRSLVKSSVQWGFLVRFLFMTNYWNDKVYISTSQIFLQRSWSFSQMPFSRQGYQDLQEIGFGHIEQHSIIPSFHWSFQKHLMNPRQDRYT